jgi:hypothetical protein
MVRRWVSVRMGKRPQDESEASATTAAAPRAGIGTPQPAPASLIGFQTMRRRLSIIVGTLVVVGLLATPVASAAPGQSSWEIVGGTVWDQCTDEYFDNSGVVHFVETATGPFHFNNHLEGIGKSSGARYVINTQDNEFLHAAPDGTYAYDQVVNLRIVTVGNLPDSWLTIRLRLVFDSQGNLISEKSDFSFRCQGS